MMTHKHFRPITAATRQRGAILITSLIMLLVMTLIGVTAVQNTTMEEKMASNSRDINLAFQAAESALREGELALNAATLPSFDGTVDGHYESALAGDTPRWEDGATTWINFTGSLEEVASQPQYIIEHLPTVTEPGGSLAADEPLPELGFYRVTARGTGGSSTTLVILQSTYRR